MKYTQLGQTGLRVSRICGGAWQFGGSWGNIEEREAHAIVRQALDLGINFFDTAAVYGWGRSERTLGNALRSELKRRRGEIILATKGGLRKQGDSVVRDSSASWLRQGVEESLRNLGVETIDLYQIHWPDTARPFWEAAEALDKLVEEGKIRYAGVSNFSVEQMGEFAKTRRVDTLQPPYNLLERGGEEEILPYCREHDIGVLVYGPLAHGLLAGAYTQDTRFADDDWRSRSPEFQGQTFQRALKLVEKLKSLAEEEGVTMAQLAIAWTLANPAVDVAIVGARHPEQLLQTAAAADVELSPETLGAVEEIMGEADKP